MHAVIVSTTACYCLATGRKLYAISSCRAVIPLLMLVLLLQICSLQAHAAGQVEAPSPSPAPQPQQPNTNTTFPMHGGVTPGSLKPQECGGRCSTRCSRTAYKKPCMFFCRKCCAKCLCVPAGTYGNKETCPCYNNWKTKRGGPKCP